MTLLAIGALGGTIAMTADSPDDGVTPTLTAADLVSAVPALGDVAEIHAEQLANVASSSLTTADVLGALTWADTQVRAGATGVVLTQGTDTLEESAYLLDLLWPHDAPLVVTGAMRAATLPGADGPANLLASAVTATSTAARGLGVLVCLADAVHLAARVTKESSTSIDAFTSPGTGPVARVQERQLRLVGRPPWAAGAQPGAAPGHAGRTAGSSASPAPSDGAAPGRPLPLPVPPPGLVTVPVVESPFDDDGAVIRAVLATGVRGLVVAGSGVGHVSERVADVLEAAAADGVAVVVASRCHAGGTARNLYGYVGSESDLLRRGVLMAGNLAPRKARLLLHVLLASGADRSAIEEELALRGS